MAIAASSIMSTSIVGLILLVIVALAVRSMVKKKKSGGCSCGCSGCSGCGAQCSGGEFKKEKQ